MNEAQFYTQLPATAVRCDLCPWYCVLKPRQTGNCKVRSNVNGKLFTHVYNQIAAFGIDPIEKKPLYHFYPGRRILSIGEVGCNLHCSFCQNHRISQCFAFKFTGFQKITSEQIVAKALQIPNNIGIAYTYNEPFTFYEFMLETAKAAHEIGLKNVVVSNGYINPEPLQNLLPYIDAFNIDLKAFTDDFYLKQTKGKLAPVLETLKIITESPTHLEITNLVIPGLNDDEAEFENMLNWIAGELGKDVPLHLSRYFPKYKLKTATTPTETMLLLYEIAKKHLNHVYIGNMSNQERSSTFCRHCGELLIRRNTYEVKIQNIRKNGSCANCGTPVKIIFH
jgi:pyruvate formate lyase activating enzyme